MTKLNGVNDLMLIAGASPTGEIPICYHEQTRRWVRCEPGPICPLSALILAQQPETASWVRAASRVSGWTEWRVFSFKARLRNMMMSQDDQGVLEAALYVLAYKLRQRQGVTHVRHQ